MTDANGGAAPRDDHRSLSKKRRIPGACDICKRKKSMFVLTRVHDLKGAWGLMAKRN